MTNIFEKASRDKLSFKAKGTIFVNDLWDLKLSELNTLNKSLGATLSGESEYELGSTPSKKDEEIKLKISIVTHIHGVKSKEAADKVNAKVRSQEIARIDELIAKKKDDAKANLSIEELIALKEAL